MVMHARGVGRKGLCVGRQGSRSPPCRALGGPGALLLAEALAGLWEALPSLPVSASVKQSVSAVGHLQLMSP